MPEHLTDAQADHLWVRRCSAIYRSRLSTLYHRKRERFFDGVDKLSSAATAVAATSAVALLLRENQSLDSAAAVLTAALSLVPLIFNPAMKARHHAELAAEFKRVLADAERAGQHWTAAQCDAFAARIIEIEAAEPAPLGGLIADCQNQMELAAGNGKAANLGLVGHALKHFFDFTPPRAS